jgi:DNA repair helicase Rad25
VIHTGTKARENWVLYPSPVNFSELGAKVEPSPFVMDLWHKEKVVQKPDTYKQLHQFLEEMGQKPAKLACNVTTHLTHNIEDKKRTARSHAPRRSKKLDQNSSMSLIAKALSSLFFNNENGGKMASELTVDEDEDDNGQSEEAQRAKMFLLHHNKDADPEEFALVTQLFIMIGRWFYGDPGAVIMEKFLEEKLQNSVHLPNALGGIQRKFVDQTLAKMKDHQMLVEYSFDSAVEGKGYSIFVCDLNAVVDAVNYRICAIRKYMHTSIANAANQVLSCPSCKRNVTQNEIHLLQRDPTSTFYCCPQCRGRLVPTNSTAKTAEMKKYLQEFEDFVAPAVQILHHLLPQNSSASSSSVPSTPGFPMPGTPATPASRKKPGSVSTIKKTFGVRAQATPRATPKLEFAVPATPTAAASVDEMVLDVVPEFPLKPLLFDPNHPRDVYLRAIEDASVLKFDHAYQMAKVVLDDTALFIEIVNRTFPQYGIDTEQKFFQFRYSWESLFLANQRGYRPTEIVRLLSLLSPDDTISPRLQTLVMDHQAYVNYYGVVIQLLSNKQNQPEHWLCSRDMSVMAKLMEIGGIRIAVDPDYFSKYEAKGDYPYCVPLSRKEKGTTVETIKSMAERAGIHIIDEFNFSDSHGADDQIVNFGLRPRDDAKVREYQKVATERIFWNPLRAHSGILVLPCGAGKTLIGINIMAAIKRPTIIFCQSALAVNQWREQVLRFTNLKPGDVYRFASLYMKGTAPPSADVPVIVATYSMFSTSDGTNRAATSARLIERCRTRRWGLMILDEVHQAPAETFREVTNGFKVHVKIGLTATLVREDEGVTELPRLVGPKLFELDIFTLRMQKHISVVNCHEIQCPMSISYQALYDASGEDTFGAHKKDSAQQERRLLFITNLNKVRVCAALIKKHLAMNHKIMIFCDDLFGLQWYSLMLQKQSVQGDTQLLARKSLIEKFKHAKFGDCLLFSRVGDQSIDLPQANVVIQLAIISGSRMQELQRVGRVQRPAPGKSGAYFYSLVSSGTVEVDFAGRRRAYLEQHGYEVKVHNAHSDFNSFLEGQDSSLLTPEKIEALERLMGNTIKAEMAKRNAEATKKKKGVSGDEVFIKSVMQDVMQTLGVAAPAPDVDDTPSKRGTKRKTPEGVQVKADPDRTAAALANAGFATPDPKRAKTASGGLGKGAMKWGKQAQKK